MIITMQGGAKLSLDKIREALAANEEWRFTGHGPADIYEGDAAGAARRATKSNAEK